MGRDVLPTTAPLPSRWVDACLQEPRLQRLLPFYYLVSRAEPGDLSDGQRQELEQHYRRSLRTDMLQHLELQRVVTAFADQSLPILPLKGSLLGLRLYGELGRPSADIDLLAKDGDIPRSADLLLSLGYTAHEDVGRYDILFHRGEAPNAHFIELHRSLGYLSRSAAGFPAHVWEGARFDRVGDLRCWQMDPADELIYLCVNLVKHRFAGPFLALDVHLALQRWAPEIDWRSLLETVRRFRLEHQVSAALFCAHHWFGTEAPSELKALRLPLWKKGWLKGVEWTSGFERAVRLLRPPAHLHLLFHLLLLAETTKDRTGYLRDGLDVVRRRWRR